jgi:hypothetical protein
MFAGDEEEEEYNQSSFTFPNFFFSLSSHSCQLKQQNVKGIRLKKETVT